MNSKYSYLAIGDSYTICESVPLWKSFPYQLVQSLRSKKFSILPVEVFAKSALTTDELLQAISPYIFNEDGYDFVTLLIGVNNQYRNYPLQQFEIEFETLLQLAIKQARNIPQNVIVLSIPDWGVTQFAQQKNIESQKVSKEIDSYNSVKKNITLNYNCQWIYITDGTRLAQTELTLLAVDGLHYSEKELSNWVGKIEEILLQNKIIT